MLIVATAGAGYLAVHYGTMHPTNGAPDPMTQPAAASQAARFAQDIEKVCNINPTALDTQECGEAAMVAVTPIHDGKDGRDGIDGMNGMDGRNGKDGRNGMDAQLIILKLPEGQSLGCQRDGGTELSPVYNCTPAKVVTQ